MKQPFFVSLQIFLSSSLLLFVTAGAFAADPPKVAAPPAKGAHSVWLEADKTRNQVKALRKTDPQAAAKLLNDELEKTTDAHVAADFFTTLGEIYNIDLKKPDEALKLYDRALPLFQTAENKVPAYHWLPMIAHKAQALVALKRGEEASKLLKEHQVMLSEAANDGNPYGRYAMRLILQAQIALAEARDEGAEASTTANTALTQFLLDNPRYLTPSGKEGDWDDAGWPLRTLIKRLQSQKRYDEALGWGKVMYRLSAFDKKEIENTTRWLNGLWAEQENFPAIAQFNKAQTDAAVPNPLVKIALPPLPPTVKESLKKKIADLEGRQVVDFGPQKGRDIISLYLVLGTPEDLREAMNEAYSMLKKRPELQDGSLQICRVFKAADCNLIRANNFLSYLEGQGENPIPAFLKENSPANAPSTN